MPWAWRTVDDMQAMPDRISPAALRRLQLRMRPVLRTAGGQHAARQNQSSGHAVSNSPVQAEPAAIRDRWFADRAHLGTPLSPSELQHGVREAILSGSLLN